MSSASAHESPGGYTQTYVRCNANRTNGEPCRAAAVAGTDRCRHHSGKRLGQARAEGQVRLEVAKWGLDGHTSLRDAGEVLLRLVTQSAARCELYGRLLGEAFAAAEELQEARAEVEQLVAGNLADGEDVSPRVAQTVAVLRRVFASGGVGALIGYKWDVSRLGQPFPVEEAIRGLARLEAEERERCAGMAAKAVAAGLAERQVRLAEQQGMLMVAMIRGVLDDLDLSADQQLRAGEIVARRLRQAIGAAEPVEGEVVP